MSAISEKLKELKRCLGTRKLKQLGLMPCPTCHKIFSQAASCHISLPIYDDTKVVSEKVASTSDPITITAEELADDDALLKKLANIIAQSKPAYSEELGLGYFYTMPSAHVHHSISCSECGRMYMLSHPSFELIPLPVYLSDSEYELIKGIYVDTVL